MNCPTRDPEPLGNPMFNQSPPMFDKALTTRSSLTCGSGRIQDEEYNLGLHVMALFVVLAQSSLACAFPIIAKKFPWLRIPPSFLFGARHFGTGVLIATAFVHLLPTAFISLTDSCLPAFWNKTYPAMAGAIAMLAVFFVTGIEMLFTRGLCKGGFNESHHRETALEAGSVGGADGSSAIVTVTANTTNTTAIATTAIPTVKVQDEDIGGAGGVGTVGFGMAGRRRSRSHSMSQGLQIYEDMGKPSTSTTVNVTPTTTAPMAAQNPRDRIRAMYSNRVSNNSSDTIAIAAECAVDDCEENGECSIECEKAKQQLHQKQKHQRRTSSTSTTSSTTSSNEKPTSTTITPHTNAVPELTPAQAHKKALLQVGLLEMGILFHSVFIGMALSVTGGSGFIVLLIAIVFHQTFEGLALGSRIAVLKWKSNAVQPWLMALAYGLTTPLGQAIGLATHTLYSPHSQTGLLMVGIMNAISSGLLVFAGLVELLAEDFLSDESWNVLKGRRRIAACFFVFAGAFGMAFVGAFA